MTTSTAPTPASRTTTGAAAAGRTSRRGSALFAALALAGTGLVAAAAPAGAHEISGPVSGETRVALAGARAATAAYQDLDVALADGFVQATGCVPDPSGEGAMGVHYVDPSRLAIGGELTRQEIPIYEPQEDGRIRLVGVE